MNTVVVLDTGPLSMVTNPNRSKANRLCSEWLENIELRGAMIVVPEIVDYELRRELLRAGKVSGVRQLDEFEELINYLPITTLAMRRAAELWGHLPADQGNRPPAIARSTLT